MKSSRVLDGMEGTRSWLSFRRHALLAHILDYSDIVDQKASVSETGGGFYSLMVSAGDQTHRIISQSICIFLSITPPL